MFISLLFATLNHLPRKFCIRLCNSSILVILINALSCCTAFCRCDSHWNNRFKNSDMFPIIFSKAILCCPCKFCSHICKCQQYSVNLQIRI